MKTTIDDYLLELKQALKGSDKAIIQDALADAHEHLTTALESALEADPGADHNGALQAIIAQYGSAVETAAAYQEVEARTALGYAESPKDKKGGAAAFFGIYNDSRAWGGLVYMLISLLLGLLYFDWALIALSITLVFIIVLSIFFRSVATFYLVSIEGLALMEGRVVEALLHIRMPRRTLLHPKDLPWKERLRYQVEDTSTWKKLAYMVLMLPLGVIYFSAAVTLIAFSLSGLAAPVLQEALGLPVVTLGSDTFWLPETLYPVSVVLGILLFTLTLHFAKGVGGLHGRLAKYMLVD